LRDTKIGGFQGRSPRQAEFAAFGGIKVLAYLLYPRGLDRMYTGAMEPS
jgi:hypothetical protein